MRLGCGGRRGRWAIYKREKSRETAGLVFFFLININIWINFSISKLTL